MRTKQIDLGNLDPPSSVMDGCDPLIIPADETFDSYRVAYPSELAAHRDCKEDNAILIEAIERYNAKLEASRK